jgi:dihydrofolate synthase/folylpolyglutamate synthase
MVEEFDIKKENELMSFIQMHYGAEVFTPGLLRTRALFRPFIERALQTKTKVTIIAGTNGKGQTAHTLGFFLQQVGQSYALWTSPHILSIRERFSFNGEDVSYEELKNEIFAAHLDLKNDPTLVISFYEFLFFVFLRLAFKRPLEHLLLEVGLGGRLDAVNHFDADLACITSISRDHQGILGNRYDLILSEKIAVSRNGKVLLTQFQINYLNEQTERYCKEHEVLWKPLPKMSGKTYFEENQAMAFALFNELLPGRSPKNREAIPEFKGRREVMTFKGNTLIFIGAHNTDGVRSMTELFKSDSCPSQFSPWPDHLLMSFSKRPADEIEVMIKTLVEHFGNKSKLHITSFDHPKAMDEIALHNVEKHINKISKGLLDFVTDWKTYLIDSQNQTILVCGSYYFVGEIQRFILTLS